MHTIQQRTVNRASLFSIVVPALAGRVAISEYHHWSSHENDKAGCDVQSCKDTVLSGIAVALQRPCCCAAEGRMCGRSSVVWVPVWQTLVHSLEGGGQRPCFSLILQKGDGVAIVP